MIVPRAALPSYETLEQAEGQKESPLFQLPADALNRILRIIAESGDVQTLGRLCQTCPALNAYIHKFEHSLYNRVRLAVAPSMSQHIYQPKSEVRLFKTNGCAKERVIGGNVWASCIASTPYQILIGSHGGTAQLWSIKPQKYITHFGQQDGSSVLTVAFASEERICMGNREGIVSVWDVKSQACLFQSEGRISWASCIAFSASASYALVGRLAEGCTLVDLKSGKKTELEAHSSAIKTVVFSPDSKKAYAVTQDHSIRIWDVESLSCLDKVTMPAQLEKVHFSQDGKWFASKGNDGVMRIHDIETSSLVVQLDKQDQAVTALALSPNREQLFLGSAQGRIEVWDIATNSRQGTFKGSNFFIAEITTAAIDGGVTFCYLDGSKALFFGSFTPRKEKPE